MRVGDKENANKKHNNSLQTTVLYMSPAHSIFFVTYVLCMVEKVSKKKKNIRVTRARYRLTLSRCLHARWSVKKLRVVDILHNIYARYGCLIIVKVFWRTD